MTVLIVISVTGHLVIAGMYNYFFIDSIFYSICLQQVLELALSLYLAV